MRAGIGQLIGRAMMKLARSPDMSVLPVAEARVQLSRLIDEATSTHERFEITRHGRRAAVLLSADDCDALQETIAVLSGR